MNQPVKIVGCVVDVHNLTLYKTDGDTIIIPQGDPRVRDLVAKLVPAFEDNGPQFYMLSDDDLADNNHFAEAEKKMGNGVVRFFKMLKSKAIELLEKYVEPVEPIVLGTKKETVLPVTNPSTGETGPLVPPTVVDELPEPPEVILPPAEQRPLTKNAQAVAEIMQQATPSSSAKFSAPDVEGEEETTVLAVLSDNTVIPGCEALVNQAQAVSENLSSGTAMENFLRRAGTMKRGHSVEDLLKFIQKGELPLANDGSVLVYKLLRKTNQEGVFVDCHSGNVKQRVGSFVHMAETLVDPNRSRDCSNGLHVARRDYLHSFGGDVCVLAKLAPEDVIAVPQYDARKLRAKGYHIIAQLSDTDRSLVMSNRPMTDQVLLGNAVAGNHVGILEMVEITESYGGGLRVTPVADTGAVAVVLDQNLSGSSLDHLPTEEFDPERNSVDARDLALKVAKPVAEPVVKVARALKPKPVSHLQQLIINFEDAATPVAREVAATELVAYKKSVKKSWTALGVDAQTVDQILGLTTPKPAVAKPAKSTPVNRKAEPVKVAKTKAKAPAKGSVEEVRKHFNMDKPTPAPKADAPKEKKMTQQEQMAHLVELYNRNPDKQNAKEIVAFKQKVKKSWEVLGVTDEKFIKKITERAKL